MSIIIEPLNKQKELVEKLERNNERKLLEIEIKKLERELKEGKHRNKQMRFGTHKRRGLVCFKCNKAGYMVRYFWYRRIKML